MWRCCEEAMGDVVQRRRGFARGYVRDRTFTGIESAYTESDAVYVWTHGRFQSARVHDDYPVFIEVHDRDVDR